MLPEEAPRDQARVAMRDILARYLRCASEELEFERHPAGKPFLSKPPGGPQFNLSHSHGLALLGVTSHYAIGIDIERVREIENPLRLARRVMSEADVSELEAVPEDERTSAFIQRWTSFEARQKAFGLGIFSPAASTEQVQTFRISPADRYYASMAAINPGAPLALRFFAYRPA